MSTSPAAPTVAASLQLRRVAIDTYRENVAYLHRDCAVYRAEGFQALSKIEVRANGRRILATVNVVDVMHDGFTLGHEASHHKCSTGTNIWHPHLTTDEFIHAAHRGFVAIDRN